MSERPMTEGSKFSRLRKPVGRLRDLPIWSKLGLIMIVPTIATIVVGTTGLVENISAANDADRTRTLSRLALQAGSVIQELQDERAAGVLFAGSDDATRTTAQESFDKQFPDTDNAITEYRQSRSAVGDIGGEAQAVVNEADKTLDTLARLREQVKAFNQVPQSEVASRYRVIIGEFTQVRETAIRLTTDPKLSTQQQAAAAVSARKAAINEERIVILRALTNQENNGPGMSLQLRREYESAVATQQEAAARFASTSTAAERDFLDQTRTGSDIRNVRTFRGQIDSIGATPGGRLGFASVAWDSAIATEANLFREVEFTLDERVVDAATAARDDLRQTVLVQTGLLLSMLLLAILFAWLVARSMARSLRELRHGALTVAQYGLPQAVARLREPSLTIQATPDHIAKQIAEPLPVRSRDEFGQVTEAFNAVHLEAVRTAAEQAQLRASVATMFVNLARRSQILVDRLIGHLDRLERGEEDPDRLAELFQLDHLATRMRRNDENLLVLAGADSSRVQREPAPLMDVLRAAQSEVEHYTRIEFGMIDRDVEIAAHSVNDMVHLVAELLDNATAFSPPDSAVVVEARRVGERCVLLVEDRGIGISPDQLRELNDKLSNPPAVDVAVSRMMGLVVVARLAARHGVRVELRAARERGTVADITLPATVLVQRLTAGRNTGELPVVGGGAERSLQGPPSRPAMGMPSTLALEGGDRPTSAPPMSGPNQPFQPSGPPRERTPSAFSSGTFSPANPTAPTRTPTTPSSLNRTPGIPGAQPPASAFSQSPSAFDQGQPPPSTSAFGRPGPGGTDGPGGPGGPAGPGRPGAPAGGRGLPPWSDLTGASTAPNGNGSHGPGGQDPNPSGLPQRRLGDNEPSDGNGSIPRQRPADAPPQASGAPTAQASGAQSGGLPTRPTAPPASAAPTSGPGGLPASAAPTSGPGGLPTRPTTPSGGPTSSGPGGLPTRPTTPAGSPAASGPGGLPTRPTTPSGGSTSSGPGGLPTRPVPNQSGPNQSGASQPGLGQPAAQPAPPAWPPTSGSPAPGSPVSGSPAPGSQRPQGPSTPASATPGSGAPTPSASRPEPASSESGYSQALDMTAEIPRVRDDWSPTSAPASNGQLGSGGEDLSGLPRPDQTMELPPIFRDVESAWFRTRRPSPMRELTNGSNGSAPAGAASGASAPARPASGPSGPARPVSSPPTSGAPASGPATGPSARPAGPATPPPRPGTGPSAMPTGAPWSPPPASQPASGAPSSPLPPRTPSSPLPPRTPAPASASNTPPADPTSAPTDRSTPGESVTWRTAADDGWRAAEALGQDRDFNLTEGGLPKRVPMSQLVPGGVERATTAQHKRTPEAVRGLLSAYHRGVQRGRSQQGPSSTDSRTPQPTQAGPSNPQGKEREA